MRQLNVKKFLIASVVVFVFFQIFDFLLHGKILNSTYEATASLWRPKEEMKALPMILSKLALAFVVSFIFTKGYEGKGIVEGVRFGLLIGLVLAMPYVVWYAVQPVPCELVMAWVVGSVVQMVGAGAALSAIYKS